MQKHRSVGYYDWEGLPCEIRPCAEGEGTEAVMYMPRSGFVPVDVAEVSFKGIPISKKQFQETVCRLATRYRSQDGNDQD